MSALDLFHIPKNIRDQYVEKAGGSIPTTWKPNVAVANLTPALKRFYPFPETLRDFLLNDSGIGYQQDANSFMEKLPKVQVKAFFQHTVTNEIFNLLGQFGRGWSAITEGTDNIGDAAGALYQNFASAFHTTKENLEKIAQIWSTDEGMRKVISALLANCGAENLSIGEEYDDIVLKLPYVLYYKLLGAKISNIFEFPAYVSSGFMDADGTYGWNDEDAIGGLIPKLNSGKHQILDFMMKSMNVNFMPMFNPHSGKSDYAQITIEFDLVNDLKEKAIANYSFIHTLLLNNMWIQYGFIQGPACLYDVKIVGGNRFFMCSGDFKLSYKGTLRSVNFIPENTNNAMIPDAYHLTLTFKSLLPNNFNNFMLAKINASTDLFSEKPGDEVNGVAGTVADNFSNFVSEENENLRREKYSSTVSEFYSGFTENNTENGIMLDNIVNEIGTTQYNDMLFNAESDSMDAMDAFASAHSEKDFKNPEEFQNRMREVGQTAYNNSLYRQIDMIKNPESPFNEQ